MATSVFAFADYPLRPGPLVAGTLCLALGLWLFHRSHADLGTNWSITLEVREKHQLVTEGIYRYVRHPMYLALLLYSSGQDCIFRLGCRLVNLFAFALLFIFRVRREERMMLNEFGTDYKVYMERTRRLIPGVW